MGYNRAEGILFSEKWEADELLEPRNYELTWAIQEADKKIAQNNALHFVCLARLTLAEKSSSAKYN